MAPRSLRCFAGLGLLGLGLFVWMLRAAWPGLSEEERRHCRWLFTGAALSLVPMLSVFPSNRLLLVPSVGGALAIAVVLRHAWRPLARTALPRGMGVAGWVLALVHLVLAPLYWPLMSQGVAQLGAITQKMVRVTAGEVELERLSEQHVVVLTPGDPVRGIYTAAIWAFHGKPVPRSWRTLSLSPEDLVFTRTGPASFELELTQGHFLTSEFEGLFRSPRHRLVAGAQVELEQPASHRARRGRAGTHAGGLRVLTRRSSLRPSCSCTGRTGGSAAFRSPRWASAWACNPSMVTAINLRYESAFSDQGGDPDE